MSKKSAFQLDRDIAEHQDRERLRARIQRLLDKWQPKLGVQLHDWNIKKMKSYWGSTNNESGNIWFNLDLLKLSPSYVEYVVVHELVHLLTDGHDARFYALMDQHLPGWRRLQSRIEEPLRRYS